MGRCCCIEDCRSNHKTVGINLYRLPEVGKRDIGVRSKETIIRRREVWLSRIVPSRPSTKPHRFATKWSSKKNVYVCSLHFVKGKPSVLYAEHDIDWAPSVNLPSSVTIQTNSHVNVKPINKESFQLNTALKHAHFWIEDTSPIQEVEIGMSETAESDTIYNGVNLPLSAIIQTNSHVNESKPIRKESSQLYTSLQHDAHSSIEDTSLIQEVEIGLSEIDESDTTNGVIRKLQEELVVVTVANTDLASQIETLKASEEVLKATVQLYEIENSDLKFKLKGYEAEKLVLEKKLENCKCNTGISSFRSVGV